MVNDAIAKEEKNKKEKKKEKKLPKEISQEILKKMFGSLIRAVGVLAYFIILNLAYTTMQPERLIGDIEIFSGAFLVAGIIFLERAYQKDSGSIAISGIEFLVLSIHSLSIMHVIRLFQYDFRYYLLTSSYIFSIYYVLKAIVLYTKGRRDYYHSLSDISEIVKKEEPVKKEAKKRNEEVKSKPVTKKEVEEKGKTANKKKTNKKTNKTKTVKHEKNSKKESSEKKKRGRPKKEVSKND